MPLLTGQEVTVGLRRSYHVQVPDNPGQETVPVIVVFHGGGQNATTIARRWGIDPPNPVPSALADYLLVFPEADPRLGDEWVHFQAGDSHFPTYDLVLVRELLAEVTSRSYETGSVSVPEVSGDPDLVYAAGFSNGGGMVWQIMNSDLVSAFRGFAPVARRWIRRRPSSTAGAWPMTATSLRPYR
jgi:poly(3-hydroxybutyrate) depolymerase